MISSIIMENSPCGIESATKRSGNILPVKNCDDVTLESILRSIKMYSYSKNDVLK